MLNELYSLILPSSFWTC